MDLAPPEPNGTTTKPRLKKADYPEPLVIPPSTAHTHSIIILHGRGSYAARFGLELLNRKLSCGRTLSELFPSAKFIFPTAKRRQSTMLNRSRIHQWFDISSLEDPAERQELQYEGLRETTAFVHGLVRREAAVLAGGVGNVVVGGLSQGCAAGLIAALSFVREDHSFEVSGDRNTMTLGGFFGMSGWLPFARDILAASQDLGEENVHEDVFDTVGGGEIEKDMDTTDQSRPWKQLRACNFVRDLVDLPQIWGSIIENKLGTPVHEKYLDRMPCFIGHGNLDERVSVDLGLQVEHILTQLELDVTWKRYEKLGHWYQVPEELDDVANFLADKIGLPRSINVA